MDNVAIRPAQDHDAERISEIYGYHVRYGLASWEFDPPTPAIIRERMASLLSKGYPYVVAMFDNQLVGYAYAGSYRERPGYKFVVENSVYVDKHYTRQGIGRLLLVRLMADCTNLGYRHMLAVIGDSNNTGSIQLHASLGFMHVGTLPKIGFKMNRWVDSYLMHRPLGQGSDTMP